MPEVLLVGNPRRRRRRKAKAAKPRRRRARRTRRVHNAAPRRRRRVARRTHARRRSRRLVHNPRMSGNVFARGAGIALGGLAVELLASKLSNMLPASWQGNANMVRIGSKAALTIGIPMLAKRVKVLPSGVANAIALGGAVVTVVDIINTYVKPHVPMLNGMDEGVMADYEAGAISDYEQGALSGAGAFGSGAY